MLLNEDKNEHQIQISCLNFLTLVGKEPEYTNFFEQNLEGIFSEIIFPFLVSTRKEYELLTENPEDFILLQEDCCNKQTGDSPKTAAYDLTAFYTCLYTIFEFLKGEKSLQLASIEALDSMYFDQQHSQRLIQTIDRAVEVLTGLLVVFKDVNNRFFDLLYSISIKFASHIKFNQALVGKIVGSICQRMCIEYDNVKNMKDQNSTLWYEYYKRNM
ncbi:hypothetical protein IMG5_106400 [Ichthyophthirius multifiliis]|uniref:Uncharacterized protein n=1 Tax=Ichthyophthirius multifiliis TaxID=5932 RepID=G0QT63_ICHMU|nr:hypothetical protein IMG5_106400 [Ichthyophthirius multifiliis]EGR31588.1 hypothetical protein IMG5_106400 [Ichthyophthirius multifiliis]|eukprot:XP_004035074.1 hypothetical protein IMG5_106400 [Ichthyophthirius multifiliis]